MSHAVTTDAGLDEIYGQPIETALVKEQPRIIPEYRAFIEAAPFIVVASVGPGGLDCSPRGDPAGFVRIADERTVLVPDRRGNNRIDTLRNLVRDPRISLLFLVPGVSETIRINGTAAITAEPDLCASFAHDGKAPRTVIVVTVGSIYFQCSKAVIRSRLWDPASRVERRSLPSAGDILAACSAGRVGGAAYDEAYPERLRQTIY